MKPTTAVLPIAGLDTRRATVQRTGAIAGSVPTKGGHADRDRGRRHDCGGTGGFLETTVDLALPHPEVGDGFAAFLRARRA